MITVNYNANYSCEKNLQLRVSMFYFIVKKIISTKSKSYYIKIINLV